MLFLVILGLAICLVAGFIVGVILTDRKKCLCSNGKLSKKNENKEKVVDFLVNNEKVTNGDVEKLLKVSDATATRYLDELEKEGKIKQYGKTGRYTYYKRV